MPYLVHSEADRREMLDALGAGSLDDLLIDVPPSLRVGGLDLEPGLSEFETMSRVRELAGRNRVDELTQTRGRIEHALGVAELAVDERSDLAPYRDAMGLVDVAEAEFVQALVIDGHGP